MEVVKTHLNADGDSLLSMVIAQKKVRSLMINQLPKNVMNRVKILSDTGENIGMPVYLVGGFVRDLILGNENLDVDVVVEGDAIEFARVLVGRVGGRVKNHNKFCASVVILEDGFKIDITTARTEFYKHPAALPTIKKSFIREDLSRRDFTINSLAIQLNGKNPYRLIDCFTGQQDLENKVIRVLHNLSFVEDPTRVFRSIRFEQRFRFVVEKHTLALMKHAIKKKCVDGLSGHRLWRELRLVLSEVEPLECIRRMRKLGLVWQIHPEILEDGVKLQVLERIQVVLEDNNIIPLQEKPESWMVYLYGLLFWLKNESLDQVLDRLQLPIRLREKIRTDFTGSKCVLKYIEQKEEPDPFTLYEALFPLSSEAICFLMAIYEGERIKKYIFLFYTQYRPEAELSLTGNDLIVMGLPAGPVFQMVFKTLRRARLHGRAKSREDEVAIVKNEFLNLK